MQDLKPLHDPMRSGDAKPAKTTTEQALAAGVEPMKLVQEHMMPAMAEVGRRFECNEYFVPELLLAARASVIQIFGTGQGVTSPPSLTGAVSTGAGNSAVLPVKVTIGGIDATVQYQGAAPGLISGALQVNAFVPPDVTPG